MATRRSGSLIGKYQLPSTTSTGIFSAGEAAELTSAGLFAGSTMAVEINYIPPTISNVVYIDNSPAYNIAVGATAGNVAGNLAIYGNGFTSATQVYLGNTLLPSLAGAATVSVNYLAVGGGGAGGTLYGGDSNQYSAGGGGGGGVLASSFNVASGTSLSITVGSGGPNQPLVAVGDLSPEVRSGSPSTISGSGIATVIAYGGGGGGSSIPTSTFPGGNVRVNSGARTAPLSPAVIVGSGGGGAGLGLGFAGTATPGQGFPGGGSTNQPGAGGGGAGGAGSAPAPSPQQPATLNGGNGGPGYTWPLNNTIYGGGGGGAGGPNLFSGAGGTGGPGGGGTGTGPGFPGPGGPLAQATPGTPGTGGGGGANGFAPGLTPGSLAGTGGPGVVILAVPSLTTVQTTGTVATSTPALAPGQTLYSYSSPGTFTGTLSTGYSFVASPSQIVVSLPTTGTGQTFPIQVITGNTAILVGNANIQTFPIWTSAATITNAEVFTSFTTTFSATSSTPVRYLTPNVLPGGLTLNSTTGVLSGNATGPSTVGNLFVYATNNNGQANLRIFTNWAAVSTVPNWSTANNYIINTEAFSSFSYQISATAPTAVLYRLAAGNTLPANTAFYSGNGIIAGNVLTAGSSTIYFTANNVFGVGNTQPFTFNTFATAPTWITSGNIFPDADAFAAFSTTVTAVSPFTVGYTVAPGNTLPANTSIIGGTGVFSGNVTTPGTYYFTIRANNATGIFTDRAFTLTVANNAPTWVTTSPLTNQEVYTAFSRQLSAVHAAGGVQYSVAPGNTLPSGSSLSSAGVFSGNILTANTFSFFIRANSIIGAVADRQFSLTTVSTAPVWVTAASLGTFFVNTNVGISLSATSSTNVTYANVGALPGNVTLSGSTLIGNVGSAGTYTFTINATNQFSQTTARTFTLDITASYTVTYVVISGGGAGGGVGGGCSQGGGGGGGGYATGTVTFTKGIVYTATVGGGGTAVAVGRGGNGNPSSLSGSNISTVSTTGGGGGGGGCDPTALPQPGGSGGGAGQQQGAGAASIGSPGIINQAGPQGYPGGGGLGAIASAGGGGGGASGQSTAAPVAVSAAGNGGAGITFPSIPGIFPNFYTGGGAGGALTAPFNAVGGSGGGGPSTTAGTTNTGGGGGGCGSTRGCGPPTVPGGNGGSGVIFLQMPTAGYSAVFSPAPVVSVSTPAPGTTLLTINNSATITG